MSDSIGRVQTTEWLNAEIDRLEEINRSWNREVAKYGACGSEFGNDPRRCLLQVERSVLFNAELKARIAGKVAS